MPRAETVRVYYLVLYVDYLSSMAIAISQKDESTIGTVFSLHALVRTRAELIFHCAL